MTDDELSEDIHECEKYKNSKNNGTKTINIYLYYKNKKHIMKKWLLIRHTLFALGYTTEEIVGFTAEKIDSDATVHYTNAEGNKFTGNLKLYI